MATDQSSGLLSVRPALTRARSSTSPTTTRKSPDDATQEKPKPRPSHFRSKSYVSPIERKSPDTVKATTTNADKPAESSRFPRLHLPGKHHHTNNEEQKASQHHRKHRYTQSEAQQYLRRNDSARLQENHSPVVASPGPGDHPKDLLYPSSRGAAIPTLMRGTSFRSYRGPAATGDSSQNANGQYTRRRANSDPRSPTDAQPRVKSPIEIQLEKADYLRVVTHQNATKDDIEKLDKRLEDARVELAARLSTTTRTASDFMRRLDTASDMLRRTADSLVDTISSFSNLSQQSAKLMSNFERETSHLDSSLRRRINRFHNETCKKQSERISELERRGQKVSAKSEELSRRLENCRTIVREWEAREMNKRKAWKGVRTGLLWGFALILVGILAGIASWKAVEISGEQGTPVSKLTRLVSQNETAYRDNLASVNVPEDVREVLRDIASRNRGSSKVAETQHDHIRDKEWANEEKPFRILDEL